MSIQGVGGGLKWPEGPIQWLFTAVFLAFIGFVTTGCISGSGACRSDSDCPSLLVCNAGFCVKACRWDTDCVQGEKCVEGHCHGADWNGGRIEQE